MNRIRTLFSRRRPDHNLSPESLGLSPMAGKLQSGESASPSRLLEIPFQPRSIDASVPGSKTSNRYAEIGELGAFLLLGAAGVAAIFLAIVSNLEFPRSLDQVAKRLSAPREAAGIGSAVIGSNDCQTNPPAAPFEAINKGGVVIPAQASPTPPAERGIQTPQLPGPSV